MAKQALKKAPPIVAFRVPNMKAGQLWIDKARKYVNRERYSEVSDRMLGIESAVRGAARRGIYLRQSPGVDTFEAELLARLWIPRSKYDEAMQTREDLWRERLRGEKDRADRVFREEFETLEGLHSGRVETLRASRQRWIQATYIAALIGLACGAALGILGSSL